MYHLLYLSLTISSSLSLISSVHGGGLDPSPKVGGREVAGSVKSIFFVNVHFPLLLLGPTGMGELNRGDHSHH